MMSVGALDRLVMHRTHAIRPHNFAVERTRFARRSPRRWAAIYVLACLTHQGA